VTGSIAAYKAAEIASRLVQAGLQVDVILSTAAQEFVRPLTFSALTKRPVHVDPLAPWTGDFTGHVSIAENADAILVAPSSANTIARLALGLADDLLGMVALSIRAPLILAPAMEHRMFHHPAIQDHLATLQRRGATIVGPQEGRLASGDVGAGRMSDPETLVDAVFAALGRHGRLANRHVVITAAGTQEPVDPVRFIGNRSSGRMGFALARAAIAQGASVHLITGPTALRPPYGVSLTAVETAREMLAAVREAVQTADALVMAAAVSDFRPAAAVDRKVKKEAGRAGMTLELVANADILALIHRPGLIKIGFAAETDDLVANAAHKLETKGLDMIIANEARATIGSDDSQAIMLMPGRPPECFPRLPKRALSTIICDRLADLLEHVLPANNDP
jgi:phosphopantothenoylcysteine decarboxylase/phosphopantothenate--cysteine ligase